MDSKNLLKIKDPDAAASFVALKRAAKIAREIAIQTNTGIVVTRGSEIVYLSAKMLQEEKEK